MPTTTIAAAGEGGETTATVAAIVPGTGPGIVPENGAGVGATGAAAGIEGETGGTVTAARTGMTSVVAGGMTTIEMAMVVGARGVGEGLARVTLRRTAGGAGGAGGGGATGASPR